MEHVMTAVTVASGCGRYKCSCGWESPVSCDGDQNPNRAYEEQLRHLAQAGLVVDSARSGKPREQQGVERGLASFMGRAAEWSDRVFGEGPRTQRLCNYIRRELAEVEANPMDAVEWVDVIMLAMDGFRRVYQAQSSGGSPEEAASCLMEELDSKLAACELREWNIPESEDDPVEHVRNSPIPSSSSGSCGG